MIKKVGFLVLVLAFTGCAKQGGSTQEFESEEAVKAPPKITQSFSAVSINPLASVSELAKDKAKVSIAKDALEKEFLLQANIIMGVNAPMFENLKSRVVAFKRHEDRLLMLEATQGHRVTKEIDLPLVLTDFPILSETDTHIVIDFNAGMDRIFVTGDWYTHDFSGTAYKPQFTAVKTRFSYLDSVELDTAANRFVIHQNAQLAVGVGGNENNETVQVRYYLSPYRPDPEFEPVRVKDLEQFGFFEVSPYMTESGATILRASKFNAKKPIEFAVSANTPAEFKQAVKEGILHWNKVFGEERIKVVDAPAGVAGPDAKLNVVQWVDYDRAGFAYADAQMDPRTGEILHAQVYMTSAFAAGGKMRMRDRLRRLVTEQKPAQADKHTIVSLAGFHKERMCDLHEEDVVGSSAEALSTLLDSGASDATILKVAQDYVRAVVAHEIGHTLGLRHNFAGSLATSFSLSKRKELFAGYVRDGSVPKDVVSTSSIMDYLIFEEDGFVGDQLAKGTATLEYDTKAIAALYKGKTFRKDETPLFCTDRSVGRFMDCRRFDTGASILEFAAWDTQTKLETLPYALVEAYVSASKEPFTGNDTVPVEKVVLSANALAANLLSGRYDFTRSALMNSAFLKVRAGYSFISDLNLEDVRKEELAYAKSEIERLGGLEAVYAAIGEDYPAKVFAQFVELLNKPAYAMFTREETARMKANVRLLAERLKTALLKEELKSLSGTPALKLADSELSYELAALMEQRLAKYVFAVEEGNDIIGEVEIADATKKEEPKTKRVTVTLPKFAYPLEVRVLAAGLLKTGRGEALDWGIYENGRQKKAFEALVKKALGDNALAAFKPEEMPRPIAKWLLEAKQITAAF